MAKTFTLVVVCDNEDLIEKVSAFIEANYADLITLRTDGDMWDLTADNRSVLNAAGRVLRQTFGKDNVYTDINEDE